MAAIAVPDAHPCKPASARISPRIGAYACAPRRVGQAALKAALAALGTSMNGSSAAFRDDIRALDAREAQHYSQQNTAIQASVHVRSNNATPLGVANQE